MRNIGRKIVFFLGNCIIKLFHILMEQASIERELKSRIELFDLSKQIYLANFINIIIIRKKGLNFIKFRI